MLETSARLLRLLSVLQSQPGQTGSDLAGQLGVSTRTIRKDIERLRTLGYPVHADRGSAGGYRLGSTASLPPLLLDEEEVIAIATGLRTAGGGSVVGIEAASARALAKLERTLPARLRRQVDALASYTVPVPRTDSGPRVAPETLSAVVAACRDHERLRFDYRSHDGLEGRRDVEPYRLVTWGRRWYLVAFDVARDDWRTFRVDRIGPKSPTGPRFRPRALPADPVDQVMRSVSSAAWRHHATVTVRASAEAVVERINPAVGTVEALDSESCLLHTGADTLESLAVHLGLLGVDFSVSDPPELVELLLALSQRYLRAVRPGLATIP